MNIPKVLKVIFSLMALFAAYKLGQMQERPEAKWPTGGLGQGGWKAWKPYAMGIVGASAALALLEGLGGGGGMGFGRGGGGGGEYGY
jgi:hypothetical protein